MMGAKMSNITVLTPAYNRGKLLEKLLCAQETVRTLSGSL